MAKEDHNVAYVVGAYADREVAHKVAVVAHCQVVEVETDFIALGHLESMKQIYGEEYVAHLQNKSR